MKELDAAISSVLVYRDGARLVRTGKTELAKGEQVIKIGGITEYAHQDSFRVKGRGKAVLKGMDVKQTRRIHEPEGNAGELETQLRTLEKKKEGLQDKLLVQQSRISSLDAISSQFGEEFGKWYAAGESKIGGLAEFDKTAVGMIRSAKKMIRKLQEEIKDLETKTAVLQFNIQQIHGSRRTETHTEAHIRLDVRESTVIEIELTYQVDYAGWEPTYDIDIGDAKTSVKRIAMVSNNTLEEWEDVKLTVSTASATKVEAVKPNPYYIDVYRPMPVAAAAPKRREGIGRTLSLIDDSLLKRPMTEREEEIPMEETFATPSETLGGITVYEIPAEITIRAGEDPHPVTLTLEEFDSRRLHYWNAVDMPEVVAQDEITNGDSVLLPGEVKVYASGDFIGETHLDLIAPREKFRLGTRAAYDVKAEKKLVLKETDKAGLMRGKRKREYKYQLKLASFSKEDIDIKVVDTIPHSYSEKIIVEVKQPSIPYKKMELGIIEWQLRIPAGEKIDITYEFEIEWEKEIIIRPGLP